MQVNKQNIRLIFGLKVKQLRQQKRLSFAQLSKAAGVSVSYLNEIEKGKKYPKTDKIISLADALDVSYDQLVSLKLNKKLAPVADLLNSGILDSIPLEVFGLDPAALLELISSAPTRINAFISTLLKIARNYEVSQENFYLAALRSFQEMHDNYFEDLEQAVEAFVEKFSLDTAPPLSVGNLQELLCQEYGYQIDEAGLESFPALQDFRAVLNPETKRLYLNADLTDTQQAFQLGKELAFNYLQIKERPYTASIFKVHSFEEVLNNFKASYFGVALLMNRHHFLADLTQLFDQAEWNPHSFLDLMIKYQASPEMFLHRVSNLLPKYFGIDQFFFLRMHDQGAAGEETYHITKELHLSRLHTPHRNDLNEHYCRRWVALKTLRNLDRPQAASSSPTPYRIEAQRSRFYQSPNEYFCLTIARTDHPTPDTNVSVTLGIQVDAVSRKRVRFLDSETIPHQVVNKTCERCAIEGCEERSAPPHIAKREARREAIREELQSLLQQSS